MTRNRATAFVLALIVLAAVVWIVYYEKHKITTVTNPDLSVAAYNQTQNSDATKVSAHPKDVLVYTLGVANPTDKTIQGYVIQTGIAGVTDNATLIDAQGANYNSADNSLVWTPLDVPANGSIQKQFTVRIKDAAPATAQRSLKVTFGNEVLSNVDYSGLASTTNRPGSVGSRGATYKAPTTGIPGWISFYLAGFLTFGILLFRFARRMGKPTN